MSEKQTNGVTFFGRDDYIQKAGYRITTIRRIMDDDEIELPYGLEYLFILDVKIAVLPEVLEKAKKIIRRDACNFHHPRKGKKQNFFSYLYDKEGSVLRKLVAAVEAADASIAIKRCTITTMQCDKQVSLSVNISINEKILIA